MENENATENTFKYGPRDVEPLTMPVFELIAADAMVLLFEHTSPRKKGGDKVVKMFSTVAGELTVFHGQIEVYRGINKHKAVEAYNKAVGYI